MGPTVYRPYPRRLQESLTVCRCYYFLLSYLKTLSVGLAVVEPTASRSQTGAYSLESHKQ